MGRARFWRVPLAALMGLGLVLGCLILGKAQAATYDPGASDTEIKIGNTNPYSGPASAYSVIGKAIGQYFKKVNDEGGIHGRKIVYLSYDDSYSPPKTIEQVRRLVEEDQVLLIFNPLGTAANAAIQKYLNIKQVPHLFVASGATRWGDYKNFPWTMGWAPTYQAEARIYAKYVLDKMPNAKIGVLYQNDDLGKDYLIGLHDGLGSKASQIVKELSYEVSDPTIDTQMANLKASGATVFMNFSTPKFAAMSIRKAVEMGWKPLQFLDVNAISVKSVLEPAGYANSTGIISTTYGKDPDDPQWANDPGMKQWRDWMTKYNPGASQHDVFYTYAYSVAMTMVQVLEQCGDDLTRKNVMRQAANLHNLQLPLSFPGLTINTSPTDYYPIKSMQPIRFDGQRWVSFGPVVTQ